MVIWKKKLSTLSWVSFTSCHAQRCIQVCFPMLVDCGFALGKGRPVVWGGRSSIYGDPLESPFLQSAIYYSPKTPANPGSLKPSASVPEMSCLSCGQFLCVHPHSGSASMVITPDPPPSFQCCFPVLPPHLVGSSMLAKYKILLQCLMQIFFFVFIFVALVPSTRSGTQYFSS